MPIKFFVYLYDLPGFSDFFDILFLLLKAKEGKNLFDYTKKELQNT
jgi:hypothetical protein